MHSSLVPEPLRLSNSKSKQALSHESGKLSCEQIDMWEHAALLYHGFDWQEAADAFQHLASHIKHPEKRILCIFNAAIIRARLGDLKDAAHSLEEAASGDCPLAVIPYVLGVVEWQLGNAFKAEACLDVCVRALHEGDVSYVRQGLDLVLRQDDVSRLAALLKISTVLNVTEQSTMLPAPAALPAEYIFEAPPREPTNFKSGRLRGGHEPAANIANGLAHNSMAALSGRRMSVSNERRDTLQETIVEDLRPPVPRKPVNVKPHLTPPRSPVTAWYYDAADGGQIQQGLGIWSSSTPSKVRTQPLTPVSPGFTEARSLATMASNVGLLGAGKLDSRMAMLPSAESSQPSLSQKARKRCIPRDPRGEYLDASERRELVRFIRYGNPEPKKPTGPPMKPREVRPQPDYVSTRELASFLSNANRDRLCVDQRTGNFSYDVARADLLIGAPMPFINAATRAKGRRRRSAPQGLMHALRLGFRSHATVSPQERAKRAVRMYAESAEDARFRALYKNAFRPLSKTGLETFPLRKSSPDRLEADQLLKHTNARTLQVSSDDDGYTGRTSRDSLELLMPKVYVPNQKSTLASSESQQNGPPARRHSIQLVIGRPHTPPVRWQIHTAASSSSDLFAGSVTSEERVELARDAALRMLEGRSRVRPECRRRSNEGSAENKAKSLGASDQLRAAPKLRSTPTGPQDSLSVLSVEKAPTESKAKGRRRIPTSQFFRKVRWSRDRGLHWK